MNERNIKMELIERERLAYTANNLTLANFFDTTLQYILELEEDINAKDKRIEALEAGLLKDLD